MTNWYDMPGALDNLESNPAYLEKMAIDNIEDSTKEVCSTRKTKTKYDCAWVKKRHYKKKLVRKFLSVNPAMDYTKNTGTYCRNAIYVDIPFYEGEYLYWKMAYNFNPYTKVFLSVHGDLRKYYGPVLSVRGTYGLGFRGMDFSQITNRRIRHCPVDRDVPTSYACCKKVFGPHDDGF